MTTWKRIFVLCFAVTFAACGAVDLQEADDTPTDSPTTSPEPTPAPDEPQSFLIVGNGVEPCSGFGACPPDHNLELFRIDFDVVTGETKETRLTDNSDGVFQGTSLDPDDDIFLTLSPDNDWIYFTNHITGSFDIYRMRSDGSDNQMRLTGPVSDEFFVALSDDGNTVYYVGNEGGVYDLWRMDASTGINVQNLSNAAQDLYDVYAILPNQLGAVVGVGVLGNDPDDIDRDLELYFVDFASQSMVRLTDDRVITRFEGISDNGYIVYRRYEDADSNGVPDGPSNFWVVEAKANGTQERRLTDFTSGSYGELMGIGAGRAVFEHRDGRKQIYSANLVGAPDVVQLTNPPSGESSYFRVMSADGGAVVYTTNDNAGGYGDTEIYSVPTGGGSSMLLTPFDNASYFMPITHLEQQGVVLYDSPIDGDTDIYSVPLVGGPSTNLTNNDFFSDSFQGVTDDGEWLFFSNLSDEYVPENGSLNDQDLYMRSIDGSGAPLQLTHNHVYDLLWTSVVESPGG